LEFTMRPGWPTFNIQLALHSGDPLQWLLDLSTGRDARPFYEDQIAIGVILSVPDYPYSHLTRKEVVGTPIYGLTPSLLKYVHPCEMMLGKAPTDTAAGVEVQEVPMTAGDYVLCLTATAATIQEARETVYRRLKRVTVPSSPMYRTDIGMRLQRQLPKIQTHGYALGMQFSTPPTS